MSKEIINVKNLSVSMGKKKVLDNIEIKFKRGESVVIAGRNGSGKSTFLRCLANVILPDRGQVTFSNGMVKDRIGFISDRLSLFEDYTLQQGIDFHSSVFGIEDFDYTLVNELKLELNQKISAAVHFFSFTILYFALFCISLFLSASSDNFLILFVFSLFSLAAFLCLVFGIFWAALQAKGYIFYEFEIRPFFTESAERYLVNLIIPVIGILLPLLISLFLAFRKFDMRPAKNYNKRFFKIFVPVFILGLIGSFVFSHQTPEIGYTDYFLTQDLQVVEANEYTGVKIYDGQREYRVNIDVNYFWPLWEESPFIYFWDGESVGRLSTVEHTTEILYEAPQGKWIDWRSWGYEQTMAFLERKRNYSDTQLVLLDIDSRDVKKIPLTGESFIEYSNWMIFGADKVEGRRFWLMYPQGVLGEKPIYQLWEDGRIEGIGASQKWPCYINRTLLSYTENEIILSKHKEGKFEVLQNTPNREDFHFGWYVHFQKKLNNSPMKEIYGRKIYHPSDEKNIGQDYYAEYARLNLDNFEIEELADLNGYLAFYSPNTDVFYALEMDDAAHEANLYQVKEGTLKLLKKFKDVDPTYGLNNLDIFRSGILVKKGNKIKVYALPDLKEVKFKKL
jgi:ABC-type Fe3+/spermidine/putrescine transport system ATPase subunit